MPVCLSVWLSVPLCLFLAAGFSCFNTVAVKGYLNKASKTGGNLERAAVGQRSFAYCAPNDGILSHLTSVTCSSATPTKLFKTVCFEKDIQFHCKAYDLSEQGALVTDLSEQGALLTDLSKQGALLTDLSEQGALLTDLSQQGALLTDL